MKTDDGNIWASPTGAEPFPLPLADEALNMHVTHCRPVPPTMMYTSNPETGECQPMAQLTLIGSVDNDRVIDPEDPASYHGMTISSYVIDLDDAAAIMANLVAAFSAHGLAEELGHRSHETLHRAHAAMAKTLNQMKRETP